MRTISSCCKMHEIALEGILLVESIDKKRKRFPNFEAIYLLTATEKSVQSLINDFEDSGKPAYGKIHVFFTEGQTQNLSDFKLFSICKLQNTFFVYHISVCPDNLFAKIGKSKCASRIATLKEIEFAFIPYESQVFTLDMPDMFNLYYKDPALSAESLSFGKMAEKIAALCATLGEYPFVRYRCRIQFLVFNLLFVTIS